MQGWAPQPGQAVGRLDAVSRRISSPCRTPRAPRASATSRHRQHQAPAWQGPEQGPAAAHPTMLANRSSNCSSRAFPLICSSRPRLLPGDTPYTGGSNRAATRAASRAWPRNTRGNSTRRIRDPRTHRRVVCSSAPWHATVTSRLPSSSTQPVSRSAGRPHTQQNGRHGHMLGFIQKTRGECLFSSGHPDSNVRIRDPDLAPSHQPFCFFCRSSSQIRSISRWAAGSMVAGIPQ